MRIVDILKWLIEHDTARMFQFQLNVMKGGCDPKHKASCVSPLIAIWGGVLKAGLGFHGGMLRWPRSEHRHDIIRGALP